MSSPDGSKPYRQVNDLDFLLRPMLEKDLSRVLVNERRAYPFPWSEQIFRDCLHAHYSCWVAEKSGEMAGEMAGHAVLTVAAGESHILNVCVNPAMQGQGLGRLLVVHLLEVAKARQANTVFLEVRPSNKIAYTLYNSLGFNEVGHRRNYYPSNTGREDALIMALVL